MIGEDITAALPELWMLAESMMTATCRIERRTGTQFDPTSNTDVDTWTVIYQGKCRVQADHNGALIINAGQQQVTTQAYQCMIPLTAPDIHPHDRLTVDGSSDVRQAGKAFSVTTVSTGSQAICRRFRAIDDQG